MKKIIFGIFSLSLLFVSSSLDAASVYWNTLGNDCKTVSIANHETREGFGDPCWPGTTISANSGQSVNVRIYYHNTGTATATNTRVVLNASTINTKTSTHTFTGQIISDQGSSSSFTVRANLSSAQKLIYSGTNWYTENQSVTKTPLLYGQNGSEVTSSGLSIGSIAPGWATQGSVVVAFRVDNPAPTGVLTAINNSCIISANNNSCNIGFNWSTENPVGTSEVTRDGGSTVATGNSGSNKIFSIPFDGATFRLYNKGNELDAESVTSSCINGTEWNGLICAAPVNDCKITSFTSNKTEVGSGDSVILYWTTNYCKYVNISNIPGDFVVNGNKVVNPINTTTYVLTGYGDTGVTPTKELTITAGGPAGAPTFPAGAPTFGE
jgi:hypothetical protein